MPTPIVIASLALSSPVAAEAVTAAAVSDRARYALWELLPLGLDDETADILLAMLRSELFEIAGDRLVLSPQAIEPGLRRRVDACEDRVACLAEASGAFGADRVIYGVVTNLGDHYSMSLKLLDTRLRRVIGRETAQLSGARDQLLQQIEILLFKLVAPERLLGELALDIDLAGAEVLVDGESVGTTPLSPATVKLGEGKHSLKVTSPVIEDYFTFFDIHYGKTTRVSVDATRIREVRAELASAPVSIGPAGVALKAGYGANFGKVASPAFALEVSTGVPILARGLSVAVEVGYAWSESSGTVAGGERVTTSVRAMPLLVRTTYELPVAPAPYLCAGLGAAVVRREIASASSGRERATGAELAVAGGAGVLWRVGPGGALLEVTWTHTFADPDNVRGNVGGLRGVAGYRLEL